MTGRAWGWLTRHHRRRRQLATVMAESEAVILDLTAGQIDLQCAAHQAAKALEDLHRARLDLIERRRRAERRR